MQLTPLTVTLAALLLGASALPQGSGPYEADCVCNSDAAKQSGGCAVTMPDPDSSKPDLHFQVACGKECSVSVDGKGVRFAGYSSTHPESCNDGLRGAFCLFDWYGRYVTVDCRP
ncbi:hypothetical protein PG996_014408 [Apiospora saccharicola]|uniref:Uncharacterized protein n=1 Tax=Apiospora saccharicola TaxID=335842 RepID=A0ABR1TI92_9PEZI